MKKAGMSTHSFESFNESEAINILSSVLEANKTIKTFFGENDRTPNHDGFLELVSHDMSPKKQFIVQIKKVENLEPNVRGSRKGKYVYPLKTNFLYYVKKKVTENPAIYFVVDIVSKKIFWLYLSDEKLMEIDFEGKAKVSYAFSEEDTITDISVFSKQLNAIATRRNSLFLRKTPAEIAEIQDALDYINGSLDQDLSVIKNSMFPNLWRFGIKQSTTSDLSIQVNGKSFTPTKSSVLALYPQIKGTPETGIREYYPEQTDFGLHMTLGGQMEPINYCRQTLHKIIKSFFEGRVPLQFLPEICLQELISKFVETSSILFEDESFNGKINIYETERRFFYLANYLQYLLRHDVTNPSEVQIKNTLFSRYLRGDRNFFNLASGVYTFGAKQHFRAFCSENPKLKLTFSPKLFEIMSLNSIQYFYCIQELKTRSILDFEQVWKYSPVPLRMLPEKDFEAEVKHILSAWLDNLPALNSELYSKLFPSVKYRFTGKYIYNFRTSKASPMLAYLVDVVHCYQSQQFEIIYDASIGDRMPDIEKWNGALRFISGIHLDAFLDGKLLYYESLMCLLYEGVCRELKIQPEDLDPGDDCRSRKISLFA